MLKMRNIPHNVLNAKLHQQEAQIVAEGGRSVNGKGAVTIATNMASILNGVSVRFNNSSVYYNSSEYTDFSVDFKFKDGKNFDPAKKYKLAVVCSSSKDGDKFSLLYRSYLRVCGTYGSSSEV